LTARAEPISGPLIRTKLSAPQLRAGLVARPYLLSQLGESAACALTLVCAPAGYGKTTLLTNWIAHLRTTEKAGAPIICWLSLDAGDNQPVRYLGYLVAAIEIAGGAVSPQASMMLRSSAPAPLQTILAVLLNDLDQLAVPIFLILDDYQFISNKAIHAGMALFLDHLPSNVHLVIASRSDPPIPLARLRARGQLTEIRANDLRFSYEETEGLFNQVMGLGLTPDDMTRLGERTEGWVAGLQMAGLALKSIFETRPSDASLFVQNFAGSNRYILDYLVEEVLNHQTQEIQDFLLQTSILENLSASLCDAVTGMSPSNSQGAGFSSQNALEYLERANLFLISLDTDRLWYRYHHLFADLLRARLAGRAPQMVPELHARASEWYEGNGRLPEAVDHALDAGQYERACRLIDALAGQMLYQDGMRSLLGWIKRLPPRIFLAHPWLPIAQAWSAMSANDVGKIEPLLEIAESAIQPGDRPDLQGAWKGHIACLRAFVADVQGDVPHTIEMAHQALESLEPDDAPTRAFAKYTLGRAYFICGDLSQAIATLAENVRDCIEADVTTVIAPSLSMLSKVYRVKGRLRESIEGVTDGTSYFENRDPRGVRLAGLAFVGRAIVLAERNDLDEAEEIIRRSLEVCLPWANPSSTCRCYMVLTHVLRAQGRFDAAAEALTLAEESIRSRTPVPEVLCDLNAERVGLWLATGRISRASQWSQERQERADPEEPFSIPREQDEITLARVQIAERELEIAIQTLEKLALATENGGRIGQLIEIRKLQALALQARGDQRPALEMLQKVLALAGPAGYIRTFLDEGKPMQEMLLACVQSSPAESATYIKELLAAFDSPRPAAEPRSSPLADPLTAREMEILLAMAEGLSNRQIAEKFILAEGTVKFYVHAVLAKLGVHNRTQAVVEAKKQGMI